MDAGSWPVRWAACLSDRAARLGNTIWSGLTRLWTIFGGANFILNMMAICVVGCCALLVWWAALEPLVPLYHAEVVSPPNGQIVVDRDQEDDFTVVRRVCMKRSAWGNISRYYIGTDGDGLEYKLAPQAGRDSIFLPVGCHNRSRTTEVPRTLPPGTYKYRVSVSFCNRVRCEDGWVQDVQVTVTGRWPLQTQPHAPLREPL